MKSNEGMATGVDGLQSSDPGSLDVNILFRPHLPSRGTADIFDVDPEAQQLVS